MSGMLANDPAGRARLIGELIEKLKTGNGNEKRRAAAQLDGMRLNAAEKARVTDATSGANTPSVAYHG